MNFRKKDRCLYALLWTLLTLSFNAGAAPPKQNAAAINQQFGALFAAGDIDGLTKLFEPGAIIKPAPDKPFVKGHAAIRETLQSFLDANTKIEVLETHFYENHDIAVSRSKWRIVGAQAKEGESLEVLRRQADGSWRYIIDLPFGH